MPTGKYKRTKAHRDAISLGGIGRKHSAESIRASALGHTKHPGSCGFDRYLRKEYGISDIEYTEMYISQSFVCAMCGNTETSTSQLGNVKRLAVDHDHTTGKVRGLLCSKCNYGLGQYEKFKVPSEKYLGLTYDV